MKLWIYAAAAIALIGMIGGIYYVGYEAGASKVEKEWLEANAQAEESERQSRLAREAESRRAAELLAGAERRARDADSRWRADRAKHRGPVVACTAPTPGAAAAGNDVRLTPLGVGLWDAAWTGAKGEPVFGDTGDIAARAARSAAPLPTVGDAVENHGENAQRCSENSRQLVALIELVRKLRDTR